MIPRPEERSVLEKTVQGIRHLGTLAGHVAPILEKEDLDRHITYVLDEHNKVKKYVDANPIYMDTLRRITDEVYAESRKYIVGARFIDTLDRVTSTIGGLAEFVPGIGTAISEGEELLEMIPKIAYTGWYARGTSDYTSIPYFAAVELASMVPIVGDVVDISNTYVNRNHKKMRERIAERFLLEIKKAS